MSNDSKKLLTLGNVEVIKDYIDVSSNNIKYYVDEDVKDELNNKIEQVKGELNNKFSSQSSELLNKIQQLEQSQGNKEEIDELKLELDALNANHANMNSALDALSQEIQDVNSIFSGGQINEIIKTALITEVDIQPDKILTPEMLATKIVALIGNFGQINATNIIGSEISGKTIKSIDDKWLLNNNGSGMLANGNISWDENGNVVFGPDVKLNWGNIEGSDDATDGVAAAMSTATAAASVAATAQATANEATALANEAKNSIPSEERITEITRNSITTENITGTTISGKTIKSIDDKWELNSNGAGRLANGNITWTEDGVVTFSDNVELKWGNITDAPTIPEGSTGVTEEQVNSKIATAISQYEVKAENIKGSVLEGKTIKSSDDKWMINNDGSGYLADNNISWNTKGDLSVKGNIVGNIGINSNNQSEDVVIGGDLIIKNNDKVVSALTSNYAYDICEYDSEEDGDDVIKKQRYINIASGIPSITSLKVWACTENSIGAPYVYIYTTKSYTDSGIIKSGTVINDVYFNPKELKDGETNYNYACYLPVNDKCTITSFENVTTGSGDDATETYMQVDTYISLNHNNVTYKYVEYVDNQGNPVTVNTTRTYDFANTKILDDGTIYTKALIADNGNFNGTIDADGKFSGEVDVNGGYIKNCNVSGSNITINAENYFKVYKSALNNSSSHEINKDNEFITISPNAMLSDDTEYVTKYYINNVVAYKQHKANGNINWNNSELIATINVEAGDKIQIPSVLLTARCYQPRKKYGKNSNPKAKIHIKYANGISSDITDMTALLCDNNSVSYKGRQYNWSTKFEGNTTIGNTKYFELTVPEKCTGAAKIYLMSTAWMNDKQIGDYASCKFVGTINNDIIVTHTNAQAMANAANASVSTMSADDKYAASQKIEIGRNGFVITTSNGCKIQTINDGNIEMLSNNGNCGLKITNDGIMIKRNENSEWTML